MMKLPKAYQKAYSIIRYEARWVGLDDTCYPIKLENRDYLAEFCTLPPLALGMAFQSYWMLETVKRYEPNRYGKRYEAKLNTIRHTYHAVKKKELEEFRKWKFEKTTEHS